MSPAPDRYEYIAASQTDDVLGTAASRAGDELWGVLVVPETTSPGAVSIKDGSGTARVIFVGGAASVASLVPFYIPINARSQNGGWSLTTGANVHVIATGQFS